MFVEMQKMMKIAYDNKFAVGAYNVANSEFVKVVIKAAEEQNAPAIIQIHPMEIELVGDEFIAYVREAIQKTHIPMALHLDHGRTTHDVVRAIKNGYNSVMIDCSMLAYDENIKMTKKIVELAHMVGVCVEAELGTIGSNDEKDESRPDDILYTDPEQAADFVKQTGIDILAVAIGTSHGIYPPTKDHSIKIDRLKEIKKQVSIPMVLHGGSDNKDSEIREATHNGIVKINLASDMKRAFYNQLRITLNKKPNDYESFLVIPDATEAAKQLVKDKMDLFGSTGKSDLFK